jgi:hypothetical protein
LENRPFRGDHVPPKGGIKASSIEIRSIFHVLSCKIKPDESLLDQKMREYILNSNDWLPDDIHVFYWIYPYSSIIVMRDVAIMSAIKDPQKVILLNLLKYFSVAFPVTSAASFEGLEDLSIFGRSSFNAERNVSVNLKSLHGEFRPEYSDEDTVLMGGSALLNSVYGKPRQVRTIK